MVDLDPRQAKARGGTPAALGEARTAYARRAWADAYNLLHDADQTRPLDAGDLECLATAAYLVGNDEDYLEFLNRAHKTHAEAGDYGRAVRCAIWVGLRLAFRGEMGPATGWFGRAQRLLEQAETPGAEEGYVMLPAAEHMLAAGDFDKAHATAVRAGEIGEVHGDEDLAACALHLRGRALIRQQRIADGLALLDEAMVAVTAGDLSPIMKGLIYCAVIEVCRQVHAFDRAGQWTAALGKWCDEQPQMTAFTGECLVHRAQIMCLGGAWSDALDEAKRACIAGPRSPDGRPPPAAFYQQGEILRLQGDFKGAEKAYTSASQHGFEPQPGLALLRLAEGRPDAASTTIRRVLGATDGALKRMVLLPAHVEIMLASGDTESADQACAELEKIARAFGVDALHAMAAHARGAVALAAGDAKAAVAALRKALEAWTSVKAPYEVARVHELMGLACRTLGDEDGALLELGTARAAYQTLGAAIDLARVEALDGRTDPAADHGLTRREVEVLRLVATGKSNKAVAADLSLSVRTVERHLENTFRKLDITSRAAATAYAYTHRLI